MKRILISLTFLFVALTGFSIDTYPSVQTSTEGGRYEIIQSPISRRLTFKLDKYTGKTYQLVLQSNSEDVTWQEVLWLNVFANRGIKENQINFQIFMSGIAARDCFLMNIHTGQTWLLYYDDKEQTNYWGVVIE